MRRGVATATATATARALGFANRGARRARRPCMVEGTREGATIPPRGSLRAGPRISSAEGRMLEDFLLFRSQAGAVAILAMQVRTAGSAAGACLELLEGDWDDDDGT